MLCGDVAPWYLVLAEVSLMLNRGCSMCAGQLNSYIAYGWPKGGGWLLPQPSTAGGREDPGWQGLAAC